MSLYPESTCLLCDLPWKNNRVRYEETTKMNLKPRRLELGDSQITIDRDGVIHHGDKTIQTRLSPNECTIALDSLLKYLYFASENRMVAYDLENSCPSFLHSSNGTTGAPLLFEWLYPDGEVCAAVGFADGAERYVALERATGCVLWCAQLTGNVLEGAAHLNGYLYLTLEEDPFEVVCLEANTGDMVWWNRGSRKAVRGEVRAGTYCVLCKNGAEERFALQDGEKLA